MEKRKIEIAVISDVHLGTYGCRAKELGRYLSTIDPQLLILNGDIIDIWQFKKKYWPQDHMQVIRQICSMLSRGVKVSYITGNHDQRLQRFENFTLGDFNVMKELKITHPDGGKSWVFHGDIFDSSRQLSTTLAKLGATGFKIMALMNRVLNKARCQLGKERFSLSTKIKCGDKSAITLVRKFEQTVTDIAVELGFDFVVCGHIHQPCRKEFSSKKGNITYLNSGDWVETLTAAEYNQNSWNIYHYNDDKLVKELDDSFYLDEAAYLHTAELFKMMMKDIEIAS